MGSSLDPAIRLDWSHATIGASGVLSRLGGSNVSAQGILIPSVFTPKVGPFALELSGSLGGSTHQDATRTGQVLGIARAYFMASQGGAWIGGGAGRTWDGAIWRAVRQTEAGAWTQRGSLTAIGSFSPVVVDDTVHYTDVQASLRYPHGAFELGFAIGTRTGSANPAVGGTSRSWGSLSLVARVTSRLALVSSAGNYPVDLTQGYPGGRFATIALRIESRDNRAGEQVTTSAARQPSEAAEGTHVAVLRAFEVQTPLGAQRVLRVDAPGARTVEINGDFTQWRPVQLVRGSDGWWSAMLPIAPGRYQMNVRIDGGAFLVPPGLLTSTDEFGGVAGILIVE
jgi:hypothetical protein